MIPDAQDKTKGEKKSSEVYAETFMSEQIPELKNTPTEKRTRKIRKKTKKRKQLIRIFCFWSKGPLEDLD